MTDLPDPAPSVDDWLTSSAPPPRSLDAALNKPAPPPAEKPARKVTPLRPLARLAAEIDGAPQVAGPEAGPGPDPRDEAPPHDAPPPEELPPAEPGGRGSSGRRPEGEIWKGCPVKALGVNGGVSYFLDVHGQLRAVAKLERMTIMHLFGKQYAKLCYHFPQWGERDGVPYRKEGKFQGDDAAAAMTQAASERGLFDPDNAVRGVGAWADDDDQLVYHTGKTLIIAGQEVEPGTHQGRIYPAHPAIPAPAPPGKHTDPVPALLEDWGTWQWERPDIDPFLVLGLVGVQMFGGALSWRPTFWITGGAGAGKSALQRAMLHLHGGDKGLIQSTDPTARGIASLLGQSTLPVALDELEPGDQGSTKERDIIQTARVASSGGQWLRGSSDQKGSRGQLRSAFLFSSILVPGVLKSQDLQRIIMLNLKAFPEGARAPDMRADTWRKRGAILKRLAIDRWHTWADRLELWREALAAVGIQGRDADNWGTTLAMAQMLQSEAMPTAEELAGWAAKVAAHVTQDLGEAGNDASEVITYLLTQLYESYRVGERFTVGQWVQVAAGSPGAPLGLLHDFSQDAEGRRMRAEAANRALGKALIRVVANGRDDPTLFVGNAKAQPLLDLFKDSQWAGGAWKQSLERVPGAKRSESVRTFPGGIPSRGIEIPLSAIPGLMAAPDSVTAAPTRATPPKPAPASEAPSPPEFY